MRKPFDRAIRLIVDTHAAKGHDYSFEHDEWSNFRDTAVFADRPIYEEAIGEILKKVARLKALKARGKEPKNESVEDTYRDIMVYGVLAYAMYIDVTHPKVHRPPLSDVIGHPDV